MCAKNSHYLQSACCASSSVLDSSHVILFNPHDSPLGRCYYLHFTGNAGGRDRSGPRPQPPSDRARTGTQVCLVVCCPPTASGPSRPWAKERLGEPPPTWVSSSPRLLHVHSLLSVVGAVRLSLASSTSPRVQAVLGHLQDAKLSLSRDSSVALRRAVPGGCRPHPC